MAKYSVHIWYAGNTWYASGVIEAKTYEEAWAKFAQLHGTIIEKVNPQIVWFNYQGNQGRVYRRKAKLTRL